MKIKTKKIFLFGIIVFSIIFLLNFAKSVEIRNLENGLAIESGSELTYYLKVSYDGIDRAGYNSQVSNERGNSKLYSDYIYIEDKLPEGLIFKKFKAGNDGTIGAINPITGQSCVGSIYDDTSSNEESIFNYRGLHYNETNRTVSFKVKGLQAGCVLKVGIIVLTPSTTDNPETTDIEFRRDFYNYATAREESLAKQSNLVHLWMGLETETYEVKYQYTSGVPDNAPDLPPIMSYSEGTNVGIAANPYLEGYKFNGWTTSDATITSSSFRMPAKKVTLTGSFTKINSYVVSYEIEGDIPEGYIIPSDKEYYPSTMVSLDGMEKGTIINGYRFIGWELVEGNIELNEYNDFEMPESNVKFIGKFELDKYKVEYKFYDGILPPNYEELLPETKEYLPGDTVVLENNPEAEGYTFLGWYKEENFTMPEEDVIIYGEWSPKMKTFELGVEKRIISEATHYKLGDIVQYAIILTNNNDFEVKNVRVQENNTKAYFVEDGSYTLKNDRVVDISLIPANGSFTLYAEYKVDDDSSKYIRNEVEITGASADGAELDLTKEMKDIATFKLYSKLNVCKVISGKNNSSYKFYITNNDGSYDTWISVDANSCKKIYISDGEYEISELVPQTNDLESISLSDSLNGSVSGNKATFTIGEPLENEITFTNKYKKQGFYKSNGEVKNRIDSVCKIFPLTGEIACFDNKKSEYVLSKTGINFGQISSDTNGKGVYIYTDDNGEIYNPENPIYYYRGVVNNNIIFADYCWKMVRTTETGGIKLIYNGTVGQGNTCNNTGIASQIGASAFNTRANDKKYVGYTYDVNNTDSAVKTVIDKWYAENLLNKYDDYLEDTVWCNDRTIYGLINGVMSFGARGRLDPNKQPSLVCSLQSDRYTLKSTIANYNENLNGNMLLDYSVALITADEAALAGALFATSNNNYYLHNGLYFWLLSPANYASSSSGVSDIFPDGRLWSNGVTNTKSSGTIDIGVRPSISLAPGTILTPVGNSGRAGTAENPYLAVRRAE